MTHVPITDEIRTELQRLKKETGVGETRLLKESENIPHGLNVQMLIGCLTGRNNSLTLRHLEWVLKAWPTVSRRLKMTPDIKEKIEAERKRTNAGTHALMQSAQNTPKGLDHNVAAYFIGGKCQTIREDYLDFIIDTYAALPDADKDQKRFKKLSVGYVPVTDEMRGELQVLQSETGLKFFQLLRGAPNRPKGLTPNHIKRWLTGHSKSAKERYLTYVLELWRARAAALKATKTRTPKEKIQITPRIKQKLKRNKGRSEIAAVPILRECEDTPPDLTSSAKRVKTTVVKELKKLDAPGALHSQLNRPRKKSGTAGKRPLKGRKNITEKVLRCLHAERERTKASSMALLQLAEKIPKGLTRQTINHIISGRPKTARSDYLEFILKAYADLPDAAPTKRSLRSIKDGYIVIPDDIRDELRALKEQTGIGPSRLLRGVHNRPSYVASTHIERWIDGGAETALEKALFYILDLWRKEAKGQSDLEYMSITKAHQQELKTLKEKTGITLATLKKSFPPPPDDLSTTAVRGWLYQTGSRAKCEHFHWVINQWRKQTILIRYLRKDHAAIDHEMKRTEAAMAVIMRKSTHPPLGFDKKAIRGLIHHSTRLVKPDHFEYLLRLLRSLPDKKKTKSKPPRKIFQNRPLNREASPKVATLKNKPDDLRPLTDADRKALRYHRERTGVEMLALLRRFEDDRPSRLSANTISRWTSGPTQYASKSQLRWVLGKWASLPDKPDRE